MSWTTGLRVSASVLRILTWPQKPPGAWVARSPEGQSIGASVLRRSRDYSGAAQSGPPPSVEAEAEDNSATIHHHPYPPTHPNITPPQHHKQLEELGQAVALTSLQAHWTGVMMDVQHCKCTGQWLKWLMLSSVTYTKVLAGRGRLSCIRESAKLMDWNFLIVESRNAAGPQSIMLGCL